MCASCFGGLRRRFRKIISAINAVNSRHAAIPPTMPPISAASVGDACRVSGNSVDAARVVDPINADADTPLC